MVYPKNLTLGDRIGDTTSNTGFTEEVDLIRLESAIHHFEELGYPVTVTDNVTKCYKGRSSDGLTKSRRNCIRRVSGSTGSCHHCRGGDYLMEMLSHVNLELIKDNPKWIQGYSDTTGILFTITTNLDIATLYANNFGTFGMSGGIARLWTI